MGQAGGRPVHLAEVADVVRSHKERTDITHIDGRESVEVAVFKEGDANVVETARRVRAALARLEDRLPPALHQEVLFDQSVYIESAIGEVRGNAIVGGLLAIGVLFVFLRDVRSTLVIGLAIPLSIVATFILMLTRGVSLNVMSLGGLALGVGMLVDNSIVVLEAIQRRREQAGAGRTRAGRGGRRVEVAGAVTASTLTTVAVFVPIVFVVVGVAGQVFRDQALTVTFALAVSLLVSLTFTPMAAALGSADGAGERPRAGGRAGALGPTAGGGGGRWPRRWHFCGLGLPWRWWRSSSAVSAGSPCGACSCCSAAVHRACTRDLAAARGRYERLLAAALRHRALVLRWWRGGGRGLGHRLATSGPSWCRRWPRERSPCNSSCPEGTPLTAPLASAASNGGSRRWRASSGWPPRSASAARVADRRTPQGEPRGDPLQLAGPTPRRRRRCCRGAAARHGTPTCAWRCGVRPY